MKKALLLSLLAVLCCACSKDLAHPSTFQIEVGTITPTRAILHIEPADKDIWYAFTFATEGDIFYPYPDETLADGSLERFRMIFDSMQEFNHVDVADFNDVFCFKGDVDYKVNRLEDGKRHRVLVFQVHPDTHTRVGDVYKIELETPAIQRSDLSFDVAFQGTTVNITPTREGEPFFWDYESTDKINANYSYSSEYFMYSLLEMYWEYGFLDSMVYDKSETWNFATQDRDMIEGRQYTLGVVGVDKNGEFTTKLTTVDFIYRKNGIEVLPEPDYGF